MTINQITTRDFVAQCRDAMLTADFILPGRIVVKTPLTVARLIVDTIAESYDISVSDIMGKGQSRIYSIPRQEAFAKVRDYTGWSYPKLASFFGKDHTTIMQGIKTYNKRVANDGA